MLKQKKKKKNLNYESACYLNGSKKIAVIYFHSPFLLLKYKTLNIYNDVILPSSFTVYYQLLMHIGRCFTAKKKTNVLLTKNQKSIETKTQCQGDKGSFFFFDKL